MDIRQQLLAAFEVEHREHLDAIRTALAGGAEGRQPDWNDIFRRAHSLKGAARAVDLPAGRGRGAPPRDPVRAHRARAPRPRPRGHHARRTSPSTGSRPTSPTSRPRPRPRCRRTPWRPSTGGLGQPARRAARARRPRAIRSRAASGAAPSRTGAARPKPAPRTRSRRTRRARAGGRSRPGAPAGAGRRRRGPDAGDARIDQHPRRRGAGRRRPARGSPGTRASCAAGPRPPASAGPSRAWRGRCASRATRLARPPSRPSGRTARPGGQPRGAQPGDGGSGPAAGRPWRARSRAPRPASGSRPSASPWCPPRRCSAASPAPCARPPASRTARSRSACAASICRWTGACSRSSRTRCCTPCATRSATGPRRRRRGAGPASPRPWPSRFEVAVRGGRLVIGVSDDGRGPNLPAIEATARARGLLAPGDAGRSRDAARPRLRARLLDGVCGRHPVGARLRPLGRRRRGSAAPGQRAAGAPRALGHRPDHEPAALGVPPQRAARRGGAAPRFGLPGAGVERLLRLDRGRPRPRHGPGGGRTRGRGRRGAEPAGDPPAPSWPGCPCARPDPRRAI